VRRFLETKRSIQEFPSMVAIQLNDTHPTLGLVELMRLFIDELGCDWNEAWNITNRTFAYTNHTVLPEALEKWSVDLMGALLPRHMRLIYDINHYFLQEVEKKWPGDVEKLRRMSIIEEGSPRMVRMANLAIIACHSVNGVAEIHSHLLKTEVFPFLAELYPKKFLNITNGVTPRRWVQQANPELSMILTAWLRTNQWVTNLDLLSKLKPFAENHNLQQQWNIVKMHNKDRLAQYIEKNVGIKIPLDALYDVQVKRIHEYKRQLLNILYVIYRYKTLKAMDRSQYANVVPRVVFFGGKAAPGYFMAKLIIELINHVADVINKDRDIGDLLKVVFIPNYCVSLAELIIPASELSQHISTAGTEASGTSNMKFAMNGCLIIGTLDGANIEIRDEIGKDNMFIFGARAHEIEGLRKQMRKGDLTVDPRFEKVLKSIENGDFGDAEKFAPILNSLRHANDHYLLAVDFPSYVEAQGNVDRVYKNRAEWTKRSILSTAGSGKFSSDRTIQQYAQNIWGIQPCRRPGPVSVSVERLGTLGVVSQDAIGSISTSPSNVISLERMTPSDRLSMTPTGSPRMSNRDFHY
jgi:starch phosphorylase